MFVESSGSLTCSRASRNHTGFTLIELLVVIVIMAIVLGMTLNLGASATRESAVEASAQEFARVVRISSLKSQIEKRPYKITINTTTPFAEQYEWVEKTGPTAVDTVSEAGGMSGYTMVLPTYSTDPQIYDFTGKHHWYAVLPYKKNWNGTTEIPATDWVVGSSWNAAPFTNIDPTGLQDGPTHKLRDGVRFWNAHTDFTEAGKTPDDYPGENRIPYFRFYTGGEMTAMDGNLTSGAAFEPWYGDNRVASFGFNSFRGTGWATAISNRDTDYAYRVRAELYTSPKNGTIGFSGNSLEYTYSGLEYEADFYGANPSWLLGHANDTTKRTFPDFGKDAHVGMVDTEDLSIFRIITHNRSNGTTRISQRPSVSW